MTEILKWGENEFKAGDKLTSVFDHRVITISDIYNAENELIGNVVVLEIGDATSKIMDADEFAYRVDHGHLSRMTGPAYEIGRMFTHHSNNDTIEIMSISERPDVNDEYKYFVRLTSEIGVPIFTTVDETYLGRCLKFENPAKDVFVLPEIGMNAIFPGAILV